MPEGGGGAPPARPPGGPPALPAGCPAGGCCARTDAPRHTTATIAIERRCSVMARHSTTKHREEQTSTAWSSWVKLSSAINGKWSDASTHFIRREHLTPRHAADARLRHEEVVEPHVRVPRRKRVADEIGVQRSERVDVSSIEHALNRPPADLPAAQPHQRTQARRQPA